MTTLCNEFWKNKLTRIASRTLASKCARTLCAQFYQVQIFRVACVMVVQEGGVCKTWRSINQRWRWSAAVLICKKNSFQQHLTQAKRAPRASAILLIVPIDGEKRRRVRVCVSPKLGKMAAFFCLVKFNMAALTFDVRWQKTDALSLVRNVQ